MAINGNLSITTYFILNKKDRAGKVLPRPFHTVLEEKKRQETEKAKIKQTSSLKGTTTALPAVMENGGSHLAPPTLIVPPAAAAMAPIIEPPPAPAVAPLPSVEIPPPIVAAPVAVAPPLPSSHVPPSSKFSVEEPNGESTSKGHSTTDASFKTFDAITDRPSKYNRASRSKTCSLL